jgi:hypothetical protein
MRKVDGVELMSQMVKNVLQMREGWSPRSIDPEPAHTVSN